MIPKESHQRCEHKRAPVRQRSDMIGFMGTQISARAAFLIATIAAGILYGLYWSLTPGDRLFRFVIAAALLFVLLVIIKIAVFWLVRGKPQRSLRGYGSGFQARQAARMRVPLWLGILMPLMVISTVLALTAGSIALLWSIHQVVHPGMSFRAGGAFLLMFFASFF